MLDAEGGDAAIIAIKLALSISMIFCGALALSSLRISSVNYELLTPYRGAIVIFVLRLSAVFFIYFVLHKKLHGDVQAYYYPQGIAIINGGVPYISFQSSYGPVFPYLVAATISVWRNPISIIFFTNIIALGADFLILRLARDCVQGTRGVFAAFILILFSSIDLWFTGLQGTNQVWVAGLLAGSILLIMNKNGIYGIFVALAAPYLTKVLALLFIPLLYSISFNKKIFMSATVVIMIVDFVSLYNGGVSIFRSLQNEAANISPSNALFILSAIDISPIAVLKTYQVVAAVILLFVMGGYAFLQGTAAHKLAYTVFVFSVFMVISPKTFESYVIMAMPVYLLWCIHFGNWRPWLVLVLLNWSLAAGSVWFAIFQQQSFDQLQALGPIDYAYLAYQISIVAIHTACGVLALRDAMGGGVRSTKSAFLNLFGLRT